MKFQFYEQPDSMDCGATCLKMVSTYYGKEYELDTLRKACYTAKDGVSLFSISEAAENLGFKTIGGKLTFEKLVKEAPLPCIIHWNQEHFVVVYKVKEKNIFGKYIKIFVADPAFGLVSYNEDEFTKFG